MLIGLVVQTHAYQPPGGVFFLVMLSFPGNAKNKIVSKSSTEEEYGSVLSLFGSCLAAPTTSHVDNTGSIHIEHTKHIKVDRHYICQAYDEKLITLPHDTLDLQTADILTKALP